MLNCERQNDVTTKIQFFPRQNDVTTHNSILRFPRQNDVSALQPKLLDQNSPKLITTIIWP